VFVADCSILVLIQKPGNQSRLLDSGLNFGTHGPTTLTVAAKVARFLNEGVVGPDGFFEVFFPATPAAQDAPPTVLQLRVFEPDQLAIVEGQPVTRRFLAAMQPIPDDGVSPDLPIGIIRLPFYEYDSEWPFPYAVPDSIRQGFSDRQEARFQESEQFATLIGLRIFSELDSTPGGLSIAQVQAKFPDSLTLQMSARHPVPRVRTTSLLNAC
jgi:hypothetical protein